MSMSTTEEGGPPPFFAILQASKGAERRSEYLAGEARGGGADKGVSRPFWQENFMVNFAFHCLVPGLKGTFKTEEFEFFYRNLASNNNKIC